MNCAKGHPIATGTRFCGVCGDDVRPRCQHGHANEAGLTRCAVCGAPIVGVGSSASSGDTPLLLSPPRTAPLGAPPLRAHGTEPGSAPPANVAQATGPLPTLPSSAVSYPTDPRSGGAYGGQAGRANLGPGAVGGPPNHASKPPSKPRRRRRRARLVAIGVCLVVFAGGGVAAALVLSKHPPKPVASGSSGTPSASPTSASPTPTTSSTPTPSPTPSTNGVRRRDRTVRMDLSAAGRPGRVPVQRRSHHRGVLRVRHQLLRGRQRRKRTANRQQENLERG